MFSALYNCLQAIYYKKHFKIEILQNCSSGSGGSLSLSFPKSMDSGIAAQW